MTDWPHEPLGHGTIGAGQRVVDQVEDSVVRKQPIVFAASSYFSETGSSRFFIVKPVKPKMIVTIGDSQQKNANGA